MVPRGLLQPPPHPTPSLPASLLCIGQPFFAFGRVGVGGWEVILKTGKTARADKEEGGGGGGGGMEPKSHLRSRECAGEKQVFFGAGLAPLGEGGEEDLPAN